MKYINPIYNINYITSIGLNYNVWGFLFGECLTGVAI